MCPGASETGNLCWNSALDKLKVRPPEVVVSDLVSLHDDYKVYLLSVSESGVLELDLNLAKDR